VDRTVRAQLAITLSAWIMGCGDNRPDERCDIDNLDNLDDPATWREPGCRAGLQLSLRYGREVLLDEAAWMDYRRIVGAVYCAAPVTQLAKPFEAQGWWGEFIIGTTYPPLVDAWSRGDVITGVEQLDGIFAEAVGVFQQLTGSSWYVLSFPRPISVWEITRRLDSEASEIPDTVWEPVEAYSRDITASWDGDVARLNLLGGWGDCLSGCTGYHSWSATVNPTNEVAIVDLGGAPIPEEFLQTPSPPGCE
jgi:hypothetical protein